MRINIVRLMERLATLAKIGAIDHGGCSRLALSDADRDGRDLVVRWMRELDLEVSIDGIGNVVAVLAGAADGAPVMTGSHIDTVATGGRFDGNLGVLAGLEVIQTLRDAGVRPQRSLAVAFFTNEEGARYAPDMLGSLVYAGGLSLPEALDIRGVDGTRLGDELVRIGYAGASTVGVIKPHAFVELHIEQGPVLEIKRTSIGVVERVQGISWKEYTVSGRSNHAGTTPMSMRHDSAVVAAQITTLVRDLALRMGGDQVGTVGRIALHPNLVNVIASRAVLTVDLRNTVESALAQAEAELEASIKAAAAREQVDVTSRTLVRLEPVEFDAELVATVERVARQLGHSTMRMPSGAGHDAQMMARICPTAMIFIPSRDGLSHNPREYSSAEEIEAGAEVLLTTLLELTHTL
jgi:N-carbamoyl-L-amino-acid hydrolase